MAKTQYIILLITAFISLVSFALLITSFSSQNWIEGEAVCISSQKNSIINCGLWGGFLERNTLLTPAYFDLKLVWDFEKNICVFSCQNTADLREIELDKLIDGTPPDQCQPILKPASATRKSLKKITNQNSTELFIKSRADNEGTTPDGFINSGLWVSIIIFILLAMLFAFNSGFFSIINVIFNPVEPILNIFGLYIWNGLTILFTLIVLILYGILYSLNLQFNIGITDTIRLPKLCDTNDLTALGYSYWILIPVILLHSMIIGLLFLRRRLINKDPPPPPPPVEKMDQTLMLY